MTTQIDPGTSTVLSSLLIYGGISIVILIVFECSKGHKALYAPRLIDERCIKPKRAERGLLNYFTSAFFTPDEEVLSIIGFDAYAVLRFVKLLCKLTIICSLSGFIGTDSFHSYSFDYLNKSFLM